MVVVWRIGCDGVEEGKKREGPQSTKKCLVHAKPQTWGTMDTEKEKSCDS
jgi:hypothetical protein